MTTETIQWCLDRIASLKENVANNAGALGALQALENTIRSETPSDE